MTRIPRLELDQLDPRVARVLEPRVKRLGYLGEFFKCAGHQPDALIAFMAFTEALKSALPDRLSEVVALTVAGVTGNDYEKHQHERLSVKLGFGADWVASVNRLDPDHAPEMAPPVPSIFADGDKAS
jgi:alkylhydroperoxidase family enzyme